MNQLVKVAQQWVESYEATDLIRMFVGTPFLTDAYAGLDRYYYAAYYYMQHNNKNLEKTTWELNKNIFESPVVFIKKLKAFIFLMNEPPIWQVTQFMQNWLKLKEIQ